jgi:hypothetical protein
MRESEAFARRTGSAVDTKAILRTARFNCGRQAASPRSPGHVSSAAPAPSNLECLRPSDYVGAAAAM